MTHISVYEPAVLVVDLGFDFPVGGASMTLTRKPFSLDPLSTKYVVAATPTLRGKHSHFVEVLFPGQYAVIVHDPATLPLPVLPESVTSSTYHLRVQLVTQTEASVRLA